MQATQAPGKGRGESRHAWKAGLLAGLLAAVAMMLFMALAASLADGSALGPLRAVGASFRGGAAEGPATIALAIALHLAAGAAFGLLFVAIAPRELSRSAGAVLAAGCALLLMGVALSAIIPALAPALRGRMSVHGGAWVVAHALFGAVAGLGPWLARRFGRRASRRSDDARTGILRPRTTP